MLNDFLESVTQDDIINGKIILIDKPIEWTSFDVVKYIRKSLQARLKVKKINILQSQVWEYSSDLETHTVETHIYRLRKKINNKFKDNKFIISTDEGYIIK